MTSRIAQSVTEVPTSNQLGPACRGFDKLLCYVWIFLLVLSHILVHVTWMFLQPAATQGLNSLVQSAKKNISSNNSKKIFQVHSLQCFIISLLWISIYKSQQTWPNPLILFLISAFFCFIWKGIFSFPICF